MKEVLKYSRCFVCGDLNEFGLKARFFFDGEKAFTEIEADRMYEGYAGIYHGGVLSALLDEVMIKAILADEIYAVTAEMTVRFLAPVRTGDHLIITGRVVKRKGRMFFTEGEVRGSDDQVYATASGKYLEARPDLRQELEKSID
ncbi:MAG TPA: PaaI family thioesterase [candidate division Zixibacteria bacterium]|nr:PaaI family thioesterase [candidate division Zixibacteria bacterium]